MYNFCHIRHLRQNRNFSRGPLIHLQAPSNERPQIRVSSEQNGFLVCSVTNEKISQINEEAAPDNTKKVTIVDLAVFTGKASLFNLNLSNQ